MQSVLQEWVMGLPLRGQGTLLTAVVLIASEVEGCTIDFYALIDEATPVLHLEGVALAMVRNLYLSPETREQMQKRLTEDRVAAGTVVS